MQQFIEKYGDQITGVLSGLDRLVFRAAPRRLNFGYFDKNLKAFVARGMEEYCWQNKLLFKDYQAHVKAVSKRIKNACLQPFRKRDLPVEYVSSPSEDKDELARNLALATWLRRETSRADWFVPSAHWNQARRSSTVGPGSSGGHALAMCCTNISSIRKWAGCRRLAQTTSDLIPG